jgi:hypothetical protein
MHAEMKLISTVHLAGIDGLISRRCHHEDCTWNVHMMPKLGLQHNSGKVMYCKECEI